MHWPIVENNLVEQRSAKQTGPNMCASLPAVTAIAAAAVCLDEPADIATVLTDWLVASFTGSVKKICIGESSTLQLAS